MKLDIFDKNGKKLGEIKISKSIFGIVPNIFALGQYIRVYLNNQRQGTSSTKTRGEVSGGGKKPWKQKGTGRARAGSNRSPIWRHGGITHGPKPKSWRLEVPKNVKKLALFSALSSKYSDNKIKVLDLLKIEKPKTKEIVKIIKALELESKSLIILDKKNDSVYKSVRNIPGMTTSSVENLNAFEIVKTKNILFLSDSLKALETKYETK